MLNKKLYRLLERSFDEDLAPSEKKELEEGLKLYPELMEERQKLTRMRDLVANQADSFKSGFADRVMTRLDEEQAPLFLKPEFDKSLFSVFKQVVVTGAAAVIILLLSLYFTGSSASNPFGQGDLLSDEDLVSYLLYQDIEE